MDSVFGIYVGYSLRKIQSILDLLKITIHLQSVSFKIEGCRLLGSPLMSAILWPGSRHVPYVILTLPPPPFSTHTGLSSSQYLFKTGLTNNL